MAPTRALQDRLFREMAARIRTSEPPEEKGEAGGDTAAAAHLLLAEPGGDGFVYYTRRPPGRNFPIYCRRPCAVGAGAGGEAEEGEEVLLDQNTWPEYHQGQVLGDAKVSPRQGRLAFVLGSPEQGGRGWALFVQELRSGAWWTVEGDGWAGVGPSFEWGPALAAGEGRGKEEEEVLYFTKVDEHGRPHEAWAAFLPLVGGETGEGGRRGLSRPLQRVLRLDPVADRAFFLTATRTKDRRFVTLAATSKTTSEVWLLPGPEAPKADAAREVCRPRLFCPRRPGIQYFVEHGGEAFFVVVNDAPGGEYGLYTLSDDEAWGAEAAEGGTASSSVAWRPYVSSSDSGGGGDDSGINGGSSIEDIDLFQGFCVLYTRSHATGAPALRVWDRRRPGDAAVSSASSSPSSPSSHAPALPPAAAAGKLQPGLNQDYRAGRVRFSVTSPILPDVTYEYHMAARRLEELHRETLPGRPPLDPARRYECRRVLVPSSSGDGEGETATATTTTIPLTLAHRRDVQPAQQGQGHHPVLLLGYGAYGICLSTGFHPELLPLLERGWVLAFAHVRGGGEKGRAWHAQGKGTHKLNSLRDYLCCADWLVAEGWTRPGRFAGHGASAGALVVAGAAHRRPELFGSLVLKVPFLDLHRTMTDPTLPLTVHEYDEWGDLRQDPAVAARLAALSPYDTLPAEARAFPPTLLLASLADDRVKGWEAAKYAAKARGVRLVPGNGDARGGHPEVLLRMERDRGHEAPLTHAEVLQEAAFEQAFMLTRMGAGVPEEGDAGEDARTGWKSPGGPPRRRGSSNSSKGRRYLAPVPPLAFW